MWVDEYEDYHTNNLRYKKPEDGHRFFALLVNVSVKKTPQEKKPAKGTSAYVAKKIADKICVVPAFAAQQDCRSEIYTVINNGVKFGHSMLETIVFLGTTIPEKNKSDYLSPQKTDVIPLVYHGYSYFDNGGLHWSYRVTEKSGYVRCHCKGLYPKKNGFGVVSYSALATLNHMVVTGDIPPLRNVNINKDGISSQTGNNGGRTPDADGVWAGMFEAGVSAETSIVTEVEADQELRDETETAKLYANNFTSAENMRKVFNQQVFNKPTAAAPLLFSRDLFWGWTHPVPSRVTVLHIPLNDDNRYNQVGKYTYYTQDPDAKEEKAITIDVLRYDGAYNGMRTSPNYQANAPKNQKGASQFVVALLKNHQPIDGFSTELADERFEWELVNPALLLACDVEGIDPRIIPIFMRILQDAVDSEKYGLTQAEINDFQYRCMGRHKNPPALRDKSYYLGNLAKVQSILSNDEAGNE